MWELLCLCVSVCVCVLTLRCGSCSVCIWSRIPSSYHSEHCWPPSRAQRPHSPPHLGGRKWEKGRDRDGGVGGGRDARGGERERERGRERGGERGREGGRGGGRDRERKREREGER